MDKEEKSRNGLIIAIVSVVAIVAIVAIVVTFIFINNSKGKETDTVDQYSVSQEDGSKMNTSSKLKENKKFDGLDITDIQLTEKGGITQLSGIITNNTKNTREEGTATVILVDSKGNELAQIGIYIKELQPSESTALNASVVFDYSNAYNFVIKGK